MAAWHAMAEQTAEGRQPVQHSAEGIVVEQRRGVQHGHSAEEGSRRNAISELAARALSQVLRPPPASGLDSDSVRVVREHQLEIFAEHFPVWVTAFALLNLLTAPATLALFIWVVVSFFMEDRKSCDVPLRTWAIVEFISAGLGLVHCTVLQCLCSTEDSDTFITPVMPWYCRLYAVIISVVDCGWISAGLHWIRLAKTCGETSPELYKSIRAYTALSMACVVFVSINGIGLYTILSWMLRNGMLNSKDAAPPGAIEKLKIVEFDENAQIFKDMPECCICLSAFSGEGPDHEVRSAACGHVFHSRCLGNWLRMRRSCPLCRCDVCAGTPSTGTTVTDGERWAESTASSTIGRPVGIDGELNAGTGQVHSETRVDVN
jgi:hypothetical protein